jgi:hypothetical protein
MQELDSQLGKAKKIGDKMMEFALRSLLSESNGAIHSEELSPYFERLSASFDALIAVDPLAGTTARSDNRSTSMYIYYPFFVLMTPLLVSHFRFHLETPSMIDSSSMLHSIGIAK